jgi:hypothetical protein
MGVRTKVYQARIRMFSAKCIVKHTPGGKEPQKIGKHSWFLELVLFVLLVVGGVEKGTKEFGAKTTETGGHSKQ